MTDHEEHGHDCCAPTGRAVFTTGARVPVSPLTPVAAAGAAHGVEQVHVPAQTFLKGDAQGDGKRRDGETPVQPVSVAAFHIDATSVTNDDFAGFVDATGYRKEAETLGYSAVFHLALDADDADIVGQPQQTPCWFVVRGADWRHTGGPRSAIEGMGAHPVVHVSWNDAVAYCDWARRALRGCCRFG